MKNVMETVRGLYHPGDEIIYKTETVENKQLRNWKARVRAVYPHFLLCESEAGYPVCINFADLMITDK